MADPPRRATRVPAGWWLTYGLLVLFLLVLGLAAAFQFNGEPIDGPFQLYNALRRINAGQRGGVDFQFFHGLAIPYLHYPLFRLLGGGFTGSEVARQLITTLSGPAALLAFFRAYFGEWRRAVIWATTVLALTIVLGLWPLVLTVNSLLALRSAVAMLVVVVWLLPIDWRRRSVAEGLSLAAALLLGTEQGLAIAAAYLLICLCISATTKTTAPLIELGIAVATMIVAALGFLVIVGGWAGATGALRYNLKLVPMDQYWYFGVPPNAFIGRWGRLIPSMAAQPTIALSLIVGAIVTIVVVRWTLRANNDRRRWALALLAVYGLISCTSLLGIFLVSYVEPLIRVMLMIGAVYADAWFDTHPPSAAGWKRYRTREWAAIAACVLIPISSLTLVRAGAQSAVMLITRHAARRVGMELTDSWPATINRGQRLVSSHRSPDGRPPSIWSTYAGLLEARNAVFHPSTDYIIHALGPEGRERYLDDFRTVRPVLVQTVLPTRTPYETWIEQTSWDFYDQVIRHYRVVGNTEWSIFWERLPDSLPAARIFWSNKPTSHLVVFDVPRSADSSREIVEVTVRYRATNSMHWLPVVGAMPRYLVLTGGAITTPPVTLDPYVTISSFPLAVTPGARVTLDFETYSLLPGATIVVDSVSASLYQPAPSYRPWLINFSCAGRPPEDPQCQ